MKPYYQDDWCSLTRSQRYRLRKKGMAVPKLRAGAPKGYKQTLEHVAKRKRSGASHPNWKGDKITIKSGRSRAARMFPEPHNCQKCGATDCRIDRHHIDGDTVNNASENIAFLCRRCHMAADGRLEKLKQLAKENQPNAVAARWR